MKTIFFITGVNGVGKSAVIEPLKSILDDKFEIHDFDERGVPDNVNRQWRIDETKYWIDLGLENSNKNVITVICGFARPSEVLDNSSVDFILLDADERIIRKRLLSRYQSPESIETIEKVSGKSVHQFIKDNVNFISIMREEAKQRGLDVIDTSNLTPEAVAQEISKRIKE